MNEPQQLLSEHYIPCKLNIIKSVLILSCNQPLKKNSNLNVIVLTLTLDEFFYQR